MWGRLAACRLLGSAEERVNGCFMMCQPAQFTWLCKILFPLSLTRTSDCLSNSVQQALGRVGAAGVALDLDCGELGFPLLP